MSYPTYHRRYEVRARLRRAGWITPYTRDTYHEAYKKASEIRDAGLVEKVLIIEINTIETEIADFLIPGVDRSDG